MAIDSRRVRLLIALKKIVDITAGIGERRLAEPDDEWDETIVEIHRIATNALTQNEQDEYK